MTGIATIVYAASFAAHKHRNQKRKGNQEPYINHPLGVARVLVEEGRIDHVDTLAAALLHDTIEDTDTTQAELAEEFGERIAGIVAEVTDDKSLTKLVRKQTQLTHATELSHEARLVKLADKLANLRDLAVCPPQGWDADRIRGYFCWASRVVSVVGNVNTALWQKLEEIFASQISVAGTTFRSTPASDDERDQILTAYYEEMKTSD